jgi:hypothetical protein
MRSDDRLRDEAIQICFVAPGLLRFARNDGPYWVHRMKQPCVYIMASRRNGTLYTGVTSDMPKRAFEHREGVVKGFSKNMDAKYLSGTSFMTRCSKRSHGRSKSRRAAVQAS